MLEEPVELEELLQRAFRYAVALTHDRDRAEELIQDACLAVSRRGGPWRIAYLIVVIRNRHIDVCRRNHTLKFHPLDELDLASWMSSSARSRPRRVSR